MIVGDAGHLGDRELESMYLAIDAQFRFRPGFEFFRMVVLNAPIETKDLLKARGYKRSAGELGRPKCWYRDVPDADKAAEVSWLRNNVLSPMTSHGVCGLQPETGIPIGAGSGANK